MVTILCFFFFQAEDGIRDHCVTGVQTCALPISFFTGTQGRRSRKAGLIREAGVLSLLVQNEEFPYRYVTIEGTVVGEDRPPSTEQVLAVVRRYLPEEQAQWFVDSELRQPSSEFVLFTVRPDRWLSFDFSEEDESGPK